MRQELYRLSAGSRLNLLTTQIDRLTLSDQLAEKKYQEKEILQQLASAREQKARYINNWVREGGRAAGHRAAGHRDRDPAARQRASAAARWWCCGRRRTAWCSSSARARSARWRKRPSRWSRWCRRATRSKPRSTSTAPTSRDCGSAIRCASSSTRCRSSGTARWRGKSASSPRIRSRPTRTPAPPPTSPTDRRRFSAPASRLGPMALRDVPKDFRLIPGMTTTAEIVIGRRTVISYLLDPIVRLFDESLREP